MVGISMPFDQEDDTTLQVSPVTPEAENDGLPGDSDNGEIGERDDKILLPLGVQYSELASRYKIQRMHNNTLSDMLKIPKPVKASRV